MANSAKMELLMKYLGNLDEYIFTGWMFNNDFTNTSNIKGWSCKWKNPIYSLESIGLKNIPTLLSKCHCATPIKWNCLIKHIPTGRLEFVGSTCMNYFRANKRRCIDCHEVNRYQTSRCVNCRKYCDIHKVFHDDNVKHIEKTTTELSFNSKYQYLEEMLEDQSYCSWLVQREWFKSRKEYDLVKRFMDRAV
jgi:hypothetical protein